MANPTEDLLSAFDGHDVAAVKAALAAGADPVTPVRGRTPIHHLLQEYTRSDRLPTCLGMLMERGAQLEDPLLAPVLLDDATAVAQMISNTRTIHAHRTSLVSAFTSLQGVTLLHVAAEYGNLNAARALLSGGVDVNATAAIDEFGINGHTPLFHTVNSIGNRSAPLLQMLLAAGARVDMQLRGLRWGEGYEWETIFFDVTPVSFAQMGLLPQVHRQELPIMDNIRCLLDAAGRVLPPLVNVPNRYLQPK